MSNQAELLHLSQIAVIDLMKPWRERVNPSCFIEKTNQLCSSNKSQSLYFCFKKLPVEQFLDNNKGNRLWAIDCSHKSGAKCFVWSRDLNSFLDIYLDIPNLQRHAYEIITASTPCRMVYDLDMDLSNGLNSDKDHSAMVNLIAERHGVY